VRTAYVRVADLEGVVRCVTELSAKTVIFDVEPLVAFWDSSQQSLDDGLARTLQLIVGVPGVQVVCFSTNSARQPSSALADEDVRLIYVASAGKPLRLAGYRDLPRPGVVIGDQVVTDGILARRLGYTFVDYRPGMADVPLGPRLLQLSGRMLVPFLFSREP